MLLTMLVTSRAFAGWWPKLPDIGVKIPPVTEWTIGGDLGKAWEGNKAAIALGGTGMALLGPAGLILGIVEGGKYDSQKRAAQRMADRMQANERVQQQIKEASTRFADNAEGIVSNYNSAGGRLGRAGAPESAFDLLNDYYNAALWCLVEANNANDQNKANQCEDTFDQQSDDLKRQY